MADEERHLTNISVDLTVAIVAVMVLFAFLGVYLDAVLDWVAAFFDWLVDPTFGSTYYILVTVFTILNIILLGFVIFVLRRHARLDKVFPPDVPPVVHVVPLTEVSQEVWEEIRRLANSSNPSDWNMAVIRADGLLDEALKNLGYEGETVADRLRIADPTSIPSLDRVWTAHRLRNTIVHGPMQEHPRETIVQVLRSYEQGLKELGVLGEEKPEKKV